MKCYCFPTITVTVDCANVKVSIPLHLSVVNNAFVNVMWFVVVVTCDAMPTVQNAVITAPLPSGHNYTVNSSITISCNSGYWIALSNYVTNVTCQSNGSWTITAISCTRELNPPFNSILPMCINYLFLDYLHT